MPKFLIEQYETHLQTYLVEAENDVEAIAAVLVGGAEPQDDGGEYIEINQDLGIAADEEPELHSTLRERGLVSSKEIIDSIRSIAEVE